MQRELGWWRRRQLLTLLWLVSALSDISGGDAVRTRPEIIAYAAVGFSKANVTLGGALGIASRAVGEPAPPGTELRGID
jgi:hypothetical protein